MARRVVRDAGAGWPPGVADAALLVVSEAVTERGAARRREDPLRVTADEELVRLEVTDEGAQLPLGRSPSRGPPL